MDNEVLVAIIASLVCIIITFLLLLPFMATIIVEVIKKTNTKNNETDTDHTTEELEIAPTVGYRKELMDFVSGLKEKDIPKTVILLDLNGIRHINNRYGYCVGDQMIAVTSSIIHDEIKRRGCVIQWGAGSYLILLPGQSEEQANKIASSIYTKCIEEKVANKISISIAIGVAEKGTYEENIDQVIRKAEDRMQRDKLISQKSKRYSSLSVLINALCDQSTETESHTSRLREWAVKIGKKLNLPKHELDRLVLAATLHDIGKIGIPVEILKKETPLTLEEWEIIKNHTEIGYQMLESTQDFYHVSKEVLYHHERWDGKGYPEGLKEDEIPYLSRIINIADSFDVMINGRPYSKEKTILEAAEDLKYNAGKQFDPNIIPVFLSILKEEGDL